MATKVVSRHFSFDPMLDKELQKEVATRRYKNPSEYVSQLIRDDLSKKQREREFLAYVGEGFDSGLSDQTPAEATTEIRTAMEDGTVDALSKKYAV